MVSPLSFLSYLSFLSFFVISIIYVTLHLLCTYFALILHLLVLCVIGTDVNGKGVRFHIPELQMYFESKIGDIMLIKASIIQHSTRSRGSVGQLGICAYMQASFFPMWRSV
jgi:hypothetical protein